MGQWSVRRTGKQNKRKTDQCKESTADIKYRVEVGAQTWVLRKTHVWKRRSIQLSHLPAQTQTHIDSVGLTIICNITVFP